MGFQPTAKPQGFDCKYFRQPEKQQKRRRVGIFAHRNGRKLFRQPENVIKPRGQQVAHPTAVAKMQQLNNFQF